MIGTCILTGWDLYLDGNCVLLSERSFTSRSFNWPVTERVTDDVTNVYPYFNTPPAFCPENGFRYLIVAGGEGGETIRF
ncbi:hypothetical protein ACFL41_02695 [Gemmatimonadota bacterium]